MFFWKCIDCKKRFSYRYRWWGDIFGLRHCDKCALVYSKHNKEQIDKIKSAMAKNKFGRTMLGFKIK